MANAARSETDMGLRKDFKSMAVDYHRTVTEIATPSADFTEWWCLSDNQSMDNDDAKIRRINLKRLIAKRFGRNISAFARIYSQDSPRPNFFSELLKDGSTKSFGEKLARRIEMAASLQRGQLDIPDSPLLLDPNASSRVTYEVHAVLDDLSEAEQAEALAAIRRIQQRRPRHSAK